MLLVPICANINLFFFLISSHHHHHMAPGNNTQISEFLLLGLSDDPELQPLIFGLFLSMYLIIVFGNLLIVLAISSDSHLHTPMYFFLANLSFVDICFTSTVIPKMLWNIQTQSKVITYGGCITQMYFFLLFVELDIFLLTVMAYDRFVAICHPLNYMVIMNPRLCGLLVLVSWIMCALNSLLESLMVLRLSFCTVLEISHFFCELNQMIQLACSDTFLNSMVMYSGIMLLAGGPFVGILYSYSKIVSSIRGISSAQSKYKAFSICVSHLSVVSLFYCTGLGVYLSSAATQSSHSSATASVVYTVVTPMLNPFIYSLRNKDMKGALMRRKGNTFAVLVGMQTGAATLENRWRFLKKLKTELPNDPAIALLGIYPKDRHSVETVEATWSQQTPEGGHTRWCWDEVVEGEAWCQMCVVIFHGP
ncbi:olfactory receptor-like protein OLF4 [Acinonyx jubatus]|uniref:Olfactory receptor-like protein OLF4 n=1 Tax=Acinonyx jubatus TaxID=32536 RepID=A0ABM3PX74_ACIJB|nr:olfactory receptor-like protein OLF4 [Acinonyx jubatus]